MRQRDSGRAAGRRWRRLLRWGGLLLLAWVPVSAVAGGPPLSVCVLANNMPYAGRSGETGFDVDIARAVARSRATTLALQWTDNDTRITEIDDSDFPLARLARGACDVLFSMPGPAAETLAGRPEIVLGEPYYGAAFMLAGCTADSEPDFAGIGGRAVAVQSQTIAHFALLRGGAEPRNYFSIGAALNALVDGEVDAALLWGPAAGWLLQRERQAGRSLRDPRFAACALHSGSPPRALRWNLHVATRRDDAALRADIDRILAGLRTAGELDVIFARYGIPALAPFATTYSAGALDELGPQP